MFALLVRSNRQTPRCIKRSRFYCAKRVCMLWWLARVCVYVFVCIYVCVGVILEPCRFRFPYFRISYLWWVYGGERHSAIGTIQYSIFNIQYSTLLYYVDFDYFVTLIVVLVVICFRPNSTVKNRPGTVRISTLVATGKNSIGRNGDVIR